MTLMERLRVDPGALSELCVRHHVRELSVFGSALGKGFSDRSDVDLLVEFEPESHVGLLALERLRRELSDLFGRPVDLVPKDGLKTRVRREVLSAARVLYAA